LLTVFHRRFGLSETEETKLERYCFLEVRINLWYWLRRDLKEDLCRAVCQLSLTRHLPGFLQYGLHWSRSHTLVITPKAC